MTDVAYKKASTPNHAELRLRARIAAIRRGISLKQWIYEAIREKLEREEKSSEA